MRYFFFFFFGFSNFSFSQIKGVSINIVNIENDITSIELIDSAYYAPFIDVNSKPLVINLTIKNDSLISSKIDYYVLGKISIDTTQVEKINFEFKVYSKNKFTLYIDIKNQNIAQTYFFQGFIMTNKSYSSPKFILEGNNTILSPKGIRFYFLENKKLIYQKNKLRKW
ncbi:MAG: hypothetical protein RIQ59_673 [Bacteroidota bacterium]|jgi:hypothetical protein